MGPQSQEGPDPPSLEGAELPPPQSHQRERALPHLDFRLLASRTGSGHTAMLSSPDRWTFRRPRTPMRPPRPSPARCVRFPGEGAEPAV